MKLWTLSSIFKKAVLSLGLLIGTAEATTEVKASYYCHNLPSASLTPSETALVRSVFGDAVNTSSVRKYYATGDIDAAAITYNRNSICFADGAQDFSRDSLGLGYRVFMHEMTHIWQFQTKGAAGMIIDEVTSGELFMARDDRYDYTLDARRNFSDYRSEQQADIVSDYAWHFLNPHFKTVQAEEGFIEDENGRMVEDCEGYTPQDLLLLKKVVEDQFPQARITRLALEKQEQMKIAAIKTKTLKI